MSLSRNQRFARNLKKLLKARNLSLKEAAAGALVPYQWLRRAVVEGISRIEARNSGHLSSLAEYLGLSSPDRFWDERLYAEPATDLTEYEADRIAEMMREYVTLAGAGDGLVRLFVSRLGQAIQLEREQRRRLDAQRKAAEEAEAAKASGSRLDESLRRWQAYREALSSVLAHGKSEKDLRKSEFKATAEDADRARRAIEFFRTQFVENWRAIGLPHAEEVRLDPWLLAVHAASTDGPSPTDFASFVKDMWMSEYAGRLDKSVEEAEEIVRSFVRKAYRMAEDLVAPPGSHETLLRGRIGTVVKQQVPAEGRRASTGEARVEIPAIINEALELIRRAVARRLESDHEVGEAMTKPEQGIATAESEAGRLTHEDPDLVWLPKHAAMLGMAVEEAFDFIKNRTPKPNRPAEPGTRLTDVPIRPAPYFVAVEQARFVGYEERRRIASREVVSLIPRVFAALAPEQAYRLVQIHGGDHEAEQWVRSELYEELVMLQFESAPSPIAVLDKAVEAVVGRAIEECPPHRRSADDGLSRPPSASGGEQAAADERPLELRQRVEHLDDEDLGSPSGPIGKALQDLIKDCIADDLSKYDEQADDVLEMLADTPSSSGHRVTYRAVLRRFGDPRSLAKAALRNCDGDISKALDRLVRQVDGWLQDEKARASAKRRSKPAAPDDRTTPPPRKKKSDVVPLKLIRKAVLGFHRRGAGRKEIFEMLLNDPYLPDHVRRAPPRRLGKAIQQILVRVAGDDDDWTRDYQDFSPDDEEDFRRT